MNKTINKNQLSQINTGMRDELKPNLKQKEEINGYKPKCFLPNDGSCFL